MRRVALVLAGFVFAIAVVRADSLGYALKGGDVVYGERVYAFALWYTKAEKIPQADAATFEILGRTTYGKDARNAFYQGKLIPGADAATFALVPGRGANRTAPYARDAKRVYLEGTPVPDADPASFQPDSRRAGLARDRRQVYLGASAIRGADPASYEPLGGEAPIGRDRRGWYFGTESVEIRDPATFEVVAPDAGPGEVWARDARAIYIGSKTTTAAAGSTGIETLGANYAKDASRVYYRGEPIDGADAASFRVRVYKNDAIRGETFVVARDRRHFYTSDMATADIADGATFEELGRGYARDARQVYFLSRVIEGADPSTFTTQGSAGPRDKHRAYRHGEPVSP